MIVCFLYDSGFAEKYIDLILRDKNATFKKPLYHKSVEQLLDIPNIDGIIIPGSRKENDAIDYDPKFLIEHIRLLSDKKISSLPIYITDSPNTLIDRLESHLNYGIDISSDDNVHIRNAKKLTDVQLNNIIGIIANGEDAISRHNQSNEWGSYRLSEQLGFLEPNLKDLNDIQESLSESLYYKKLFLKESLEPVYELSDNQFQDVKHKLSFINANTKKVAIIDDMINLGWKEAYLKIFLNSNVQCFDQKNNIFKAEDSQSFDLIILDLRLTEEAKGDLVDIMKIENLSGIQLLKEIKKQDPSAPVIISTASNKSWSLNSVLNNGADGYWSKEDPKRGLSMEYRFENTVSLLSTIENVLRYSIQTRCIYRAFKDIYDELSYVNPLVAKSINEKLKIVFGQLSWNKNDFLQGYIGQSGLVISYITICSLLNEVISAFRIKKKSEDSGSIYKWYIRIDEKEILFCDEEVVEGKKFNQYCLSEDVINLISKPGYNFDVVDKFFPEKQFMNSILQIKNLGHLRSKYGTYSGIRNALDIIHGKSIKEKNDKDIHELTINDHYEVLNIFYQIFIGEECDYFPLKKYK